jgi:hypothetical protein
VPVEALEKRPDVYPWGWVLDAFGQLHACRSAGFGGAEPIRAESVLAWLDIHGIDDRDMRADVYAMLVAMDVAWRKAAAEKPGR